MVCGIQGRHTTQRVSDLVLAGPTHSTVFLPINTTLEVLMAPHTLGDFKSHLSSHVARASGFGSASFWWCWIVCLTRINLDARSRSVTVDLLVVISAAYPLLSCSDVRDCHGPFATTRVAFFSDTCWCPSQPVSGTSCELVCVSNDEQGIPLKLSL